MAIIDIEELRKRGKYISCVKHPILDLLIWNYNPRCQYDKAWDEYTMQCRGLITDLKGNIVSRPFRKFFNVNEREETQIYRLPNEILEVRDKLDGVLGIQYYEGDKVCIATRGVFTSPWALWATQWMQERFSRYNFLPGFTYLYEIIYPEGRIIIDYGNKAELVLLAVIDTETGGESNIDQIGEALGLNVPELLPFNNLYEVVFESKELPIEKEGYVVKFPNNLRVKVKGDAYTRTQMAVMHCSTTAIWEILKAGGSIGILLDYLPDEAYRWVNDKARMILDNYECLEKDIWFWTGVAKSISLSRKKQAEYLLDNLDKAKAALVFMKLDNKDIKDKLWDMVKPEFEKPNLAMEVTG